jgi:hypothetical protein
MPSEDTGTQLTSSSIGTARSRDFRSARASSSGIASTWSLDTLRRARSISAPAWCAVWLTRHHTAGCLSPDLAAGIGRVKGVEKIPASNGLTTEQSQRLWEAPDVERFEGETRSCAIGRHAHLRASTARSGLSELWPHCGRNTGPSSTKRVRPAIPEQHRCRGWVKALLDECFGQPT